MRPITPRSTARSDLTGEKYSFADRHDLEHHEILLPKGAPEEMRDFEVFWNKAQMAEKRINSQEAKELLLALPANPEITDKMRLEMTRGFVQEHFVDHGVGAQFDIHSSHALSADELKDGVGDVGGSCGQRCCQPSCPCSCDHPLY